MKFFGIRKRSWKKILTVGLSVLLIVGAVAGCVALFGKETKTVNPVFSVGALDENGRYVESENSLYTKEAFECRGLKIVPEFESNIEYQVFYYGEHDQFIGASEVLTEGQHVPMSELAVYARVVITPYDSKNMNINLKFWDVVKYAGLVKITVDQNQDYEVPNLFEEAKKNPYEGDGNPDDLPSTELLKYSFYKDCNFSKSVEAGSPLDIYKSDISVGRNVCIIPCANVASFYISGNVNVSDGVALCVSVDDGGNLCVSKVESLLNDTSFEIPETAKYFVLETTYDLEVSVFEYR